MCCSQFPRGVDGAEAGAAMPRPATIRIRKRLREVVDEPKVADFRKCSLDAGAMEAVLRLDELQDEHQERTCMWALNPVTEPVMSDNLVRSQIRCPDLSKMSVPSMGPSTLAQLISKRELSTEILVVCSTW